MKLRGLTKSVCWYVRWRIARKYFHYKGNEERLEDAEWEVVRWTFRFIGEMMLRKLEREL